MAVTGITLRSVKGSELTFAEMDTNFNNLKSAIEAIQTVNAVTVDTTQTVTAPKTFANDVKLTGIAETVYDHGSVSSGTVTVNANSGTVHKMTLTGNITINDVLNAQTGSSVTIFLTQDGTGGRTLSSTAKFAAGFKTLSSAASATDVVTLFYDGSTYWGNLSRGFA